MDQLDFIDCGSHYICIERGCNADILNIISNLDKYKIKNVYITKAGVEVVTFYDNFVCRYDGRCWSLHGLRSIRFEISIYYKKYLKN